MIAGHINHLKGAAMGNIRTLLTCAVAVAGAVVGAQQPTAQPPTSLVEEVRRYYTTVQGFIVKAAEQFPEDKLTWQPTPAVRSWARLVAHVVDDNNGACYALAGEASRPARLDTEDTPNSAANKMTKADLQKALTESVARCEKAFAAVNESNMMERQGNRSKIGALIYNTSHTNEHYGNMVTYIRLNGLVPPSSQRGGM
jgi:uncharacterized damage-inducible protein DinB